MRMRHQNMKHFLFNFNYLHSLDSVNMPSRSVKPSLYPPIPFHSIRSISLLSSVIVAIILAVFIYNLHKDGYKLPWAFLIVRLSLPFPLLQQLTANSSS